MKNPGIYLSLLLVSACTSHPVYHPPETATTPSQWQHQAVPADMPTAGWLTTLGDTYLTGLVDEALNNNHNVKAQTARVQQAEQQRIISGAPRLPSLDASFSGTRRMGQISGIVTTSKNFSATLDLSWEIDIWGKLSATQKQASLNLAAQRARLQRVRQQLVADVCNAWFDVIEAQNLLTLFEHRLQNLKGNLTIIEDGYNKGLNTALDVFLARTNVEQESTRTEAQRLSLAGARQHLQLLLGRYPDAGAFSERELPLVDGDVPAGLPSTLIDRRPDIRSSWLELLAGDAGVAVAHRQRFPSLSLTGSIGQSSSALKDLLSGDSRVWSLSGGLLQPLFNAGALAAREAQAQGELEQKEQQYLDSVLQAFAEVESALIGERNLKTQYQRSVAAERSALAAEDLSFEQYQRGLVSYTTVLEAERRAVDAQSSVVQLKRQRLRNRIDLFLALGGNFGETTSEQNP